MIRNSAFLIFSLVTFFSSFAQKEITLEAIWGGEFRTQYLEEIQHLNNGKEFSVFEFDKEKRETKIIAKKYTDVNERRLILSALDISELSYFETYKFNANESKVLLGLDYKQQYRYSSSALYYVYDFNTKKVFQIGDERIFNPTFSPNGEQIAYVFQNDIYVQNINSNKRIRVTADGLKNKIINGMSDWVYEEEFELVRAYEWNATSTHIAYLKFDESKVLAYSMPVYGTGNYPVNQNFKYPKAGEANSVVSAYVFSLEKKKSAKVSVFKKDSDYIPRLQRTNDSDLFCLQLMNRKQNKLDFNYINLKGKLEKPFYTETDKAYVEITDDLTFLKDDSFIKSNEKSGFRHLYHFTKDGKQINQITKGNWEVTKLYGVHKNVLFYQSTEKGSTERHIYSIHLDGTHKKCLTNDSGVHTANFNKEYTLFLDEFSSTEVPTKTEVKDINTVKVLNTLISNNAIKEKLKLYKFSDKELQTIEINGETLNMWMIKPNNFDPSKKYPVLLYQYAGPGSQTVANKWYGYDDYWHQLLANKGYIVTCLDGRGTGYKGRDFKKLTQHQLGKLEAEDQIAFAKKLSESPYVDSSRIGIWGWSYGGFNALNAILKGNEVFKTAIAVAPVTHWKFYDTIYTERFLGTPQNNPKGYDDNSPLSHAEKLKGNVLLVHGTADDNVHLQNTLAMVNAFTRANKQFDLAIYTDKNHGIYGGNTRLQLYTKMTNYILGKL